MNTTTRSALLGALLVATTAYAGTVQAGGQRGPGRALFGPVFHEVRTARALGLTPRQRAEVRALVADARNEAEPVVEQMLDLREQRHALRDADGFDEARVRSLAEAGARLKVELSVIAARTHSQIRALLTPEQREKMKTLRHRHAKRSGARR